MGSIVGRNGAGKSTLLEGLQWIDAAIRGTVNTACDRYNGIADRVNHRYAKAARGFELHTRLEWGEYLLRHLLADPQQAALLRAHAIAQRLAHLLPRRS
ncbi:ATP-binding protein [Nannocystis pusilla]|uniref:ABC transporter domain-containing protein n=1 Tax=Nannocystis pusilla TaxID=889268 RepID=A0ABS7TSC7_9BACT|nr:ATP-binding protein [Nannocystis pusilla]MBZ5710956.1 hypothetical protein [Nannocystis pusilla]